MEIYIKKRIKTEENKKLKRETRLALLHRLLLLWKLNFCFLEKKSPSFHFRRAFNSNHNAKLSESHGGFVGLLFHKLTLFFSRVV